MCDTVGQEPLPPSFQWTWEALPPHRRSPSPTLWPLGIPTLLTTTGGSTLLTSGQNLGLSCVALKWEPLPPPFLKRDQHHLLTENPIAPFSQLPAVLLCWDQAPGNILDRLSCVALEQGPFFPLNAWPVQCSPFTWPNLDLLGHDKVSWPHSDNSLRPCPNIKTPSP